MNVEEKLIIISEELFPDYVNVIREPLEKYKEKIEKEKDKKFKLWQALRIHPDEGLNNDRIGEYFYKDVISDSSFRSKYKKSIADFLSKKRHQLMSNQGTRLNSKLLKRRHQSLTPKQLACNAYIAVKDNNIVLITNQKEILEILYGQITDPTGSKELEKLREEAYIELRNFLEKDVPLIEIEKPRIIYDNLISEEMPDTIEEKISTFEEVEWFVNELPEIRGLENIKIVMEVNIFSNGNCKAIVKILAVNLSNQIIEEIHHKLWGTVKANKNKINLNVRDGKGNLNYYYIIDDEKFKEIKIIPRRKIEPLSTYSYICEWNWPDSYKNIFNKEDYEYNVERPILKYLVRLVMPENTKIKFCNCVDYFCETKNKLKLRKDNLKNPPEIILLLNNVKMGHKLVIEFGVTN